ncbi:hypothetical protein A4A49_06145 [Nicotiana attenuata]|uniref:Uncharacterized protein n=1 Tax=Nicotiana attenuata TaxID=49451 RepID=A0A1J6IMC7_NICAT|nr:hypothetical protein A4A49_06145 [Nicotiana attenuata]
MKITIGFLILLSAVGLTSLASDTSYASKNKGIHVVKHVSEVHDRNSESKVGDRRANVGEGQKGRGPNGGANNFHHPNPYKSSALPLKQSSIFTSTTGSIFRSSLLLVLLFVI